MTIKLEALVQSNRLRVFEINERERNYLGFVNLEEPTEERVLRDLALVLYAKVAKYLEKMPKFDIQVVKEDYKRI